MHPAKLSILVQARALAAMEAKSHSTPTADLADLCEALDRIAPNAQDEWEERVFNGGNRVGPAHAMVLTLLRGEWFMQPEDTQEQEDAFNALTEALGEAMTDDQRDSWDYWCLKATPTEIVTEAFATLYLLTDSEAKVWPRAYSQISD